MEECCTQWQRDLRAQTVRTYRETMRSIVEIRQEFCVDILRTGVVSLVLFKGARGYPATAKDVTAEEMRHIGWFGHRVEVGPSRFTYYRLECYSGDPKTMAVVGKNVFMLSVDEEVLGMLLPTGKWLDWCESYSRKPVSEE